MFDHGVECATNQECQTALDSVQEFARMGNWRSEDLPDEMGEQGKHQEQECTDPDQEVYRQLWGLDFLLVHTARILFRPMASLPGLARLGEVRDPEHDDHHFRYPTRPPISVIPQLTMIAVTNFADRRRHALDAGREQ
jgi:hypothetical protein